MPDDGSGSGGSISIHPAWITYAPNTANSGSGSGGGISVRPAGDSALLLTLDDSMTAQDLPRHVREITTCLHDTLEPGIEEVVPAYRTVFVRYNPLILLVEEAITLVISRLENRAPQDVQPTHRRRTVEIPVCYGGIHGPDLDDVAAHCGLSPNEVIAQHSQANYRVLFLGFTPGFPFLSGLPASLHTPRLTSPRTHVPAGSVGIAAGQTGFYPIASPGGWRLIGRTPLSLFDPAQPTIFAYAPGDSIRFVPIDSETFDRLAPAPGTR